MMNKKHTSLSPLTPKNFNTQNLFTRDNKVCKGVSQQHEILRLFTAPMGEQQPLIKLKKWNLVALWSLDMKVETCAICRNHIMDTCVECQNGATGGEECKVSWGVCNHAFHTHCITRWLSSRNVCPLDTKKWVYHNPEGK